MSEHLPALPRDNPNLIQEFTRFIVNNEAGWRPPAVVLPLSAVCSILFVESSPITPLIYAGLG